MNKKRFLAVLAAATMLVSAVPTYAADPNVVTGEGTSVGEITGGSTIADFSKDEIYKVTLPTSNSLDFIVDPQNLTQLASGESMEVDINTTGSGVIFSNGIAAIKNESNVDVVVTVKLTAAGDGVNFMSTQEEMDPESDTADMFLAAVPGVNKVTIASDQSVENYVATGTAVAITEAEASLAFKLNKAIYVATNNGTSFDYGIATGDKYADNYDAAAFKIGGVVNKNADWSVVSASGLYITAVFDLAKATGTEEAVDGLYDVVDTTTTNYTPVEAGAVAGMKEAEFTYATTGSFVPTGDDKFDVSVEEKVTATVNGNPVDISAMTDSKISIKKSAITAALGAAAEKGDELTIIVTDAAGVKYKAVCVID